MKKLLTLIAVCLLASNFLSAQHKIMVHNSGNVSYQSSTSVIDSVKFKNTSSIFSFKDGVNMAVALSEIDSITFEPETTADSLRDDVVYITYNQSSATVVNPYETQGVSVVANGSHVSVAATSGIGNIKYFVSGSSADGSLSIASNEPVAITLSNLSLTRKSGTPISITTAVDATIGLEGTNEISDTENGKSATLLSSGNLIFTGSGRLTISGYKKHAISSSETITVENGTIIIPQSASDGLHSEAFVMNGGFIDIALPAGDGIDAGAGTATINNGTIQIVSDASDVKGIKADDVLTINGGTIVMDIAGAQSKAFSGKSHFVMNGGSATITTSGKTVLEASGSGYDPSYCTAIKTKGNVEINSGTLLIESLSTADGGKGISADGDIAIHNGNITISTAGTGTTYTNENGEKDSYTSCCIKADGNISLLGGRIACTSTGGGGKGISADGTLVIGTLLANNNALVLNVTTSGERFYVSGSTSGMQDNADYANPKAIKSEGNLTVNSGTITIRCTQNNEGGEGLESKDTLTINGGIIDIEAYDDCINASNHIAITGGTVHCLSRGNDGIDSNGTLSVSGGLTITTGTSAPEGGIDCDQSRFAITGGTLVSTGGSNSTPTSNACTQYAITYSALTAGNAICIKNSSNEIILLYQLPTYTSGGGNFGGPGGNSNSMALVFTAPSLSAGSYTLHTGGTISGGTTVNGYNTGGTYSGGSSRSFSISSMVTNVR